MSAGTLWGEIANWVIKHW